MERVLKTESRFSDVDLTIPLNSEDIMAKIEQSDCFGKVWDLRTVECSKCAERDVCGIIFNETVKGKVKEVQQEQGAIFIDLSDFDRVNKNTVFDWVVSGETKVQDLLTYVMSLACTSDQEAGIQFLKKFITNTEGINTKSGIVWIS